MLFGLFVALTGIARRELDSLLCFDSRLQLPAAFDLGIELRPKKQRDVRDPHPEQENDHTTDRAVRLVVAREVRRVKRESGRGQHPHHESNKCAQTHPAELRLANVGSRVVQRRDDQYRQRSEDWPAHNVPDEQSTLAQPDNVSDTSSDWSTQRNQHSGDHSGHNGEHSDQQGHGAQLPERATLVDGVDAVHRSPEGAHKSRGGP